MQPQGLRTPLTGMLMMCAAMLVIPLMDGIAKHLSARYTVLEVVWARYFFHLLLMLPPVLWVHGRAALWPARAGLQLARSAVLLGATACYFAAIAVMPLADALALTFVSPLLVTLASPLVLGERVGPRRLAAVLAGFAGVCLILRPGGAVWQWGSLLALATGVCYAAYYLITRKLSGSAPATVTLTFTAVVGAVVCSAALAPQWRTPALGDLGLMLAMGGVAALSHFMMIRACDFAEASLLAPFVYLEILGATLIGLVWFGDLPDAWTGTGIAVVVGSGVYISMRERRVKAVTSVTVP